MSHEEQSPPPEMMPPATEEALDYKDKYLRLLAETENMRKRMQKEKQEMTRYAIDNILAEIIAPLDSFEQALELASNMSQDVKNWAVGFQMILSQFKQVLQDNHVVSFKSEGESFDPHKHDAIELEESEAIEPGIVLKEYVRGYKSGERIIRPARVKVSKKKKDSEESTNHLSE